jgi:hypothetical protein
MPRFSSTCCLSHVSGLLKNIGIDEKKIKIKKPGTLMFFYLLRPITCT